MAFYYYYGYQPAYVPVQLEIRRPYVHYKGQPKNGPKSRSYQPCKFFWQGHCKYGAACRFNHLPPPAASGPARPNATPPTGPKRGNNSSVTKAFGKGGGLLPTPPRTPKPAVETSVLGFREVPPARLAAKASCDFCKYDMHGCPCWLFDDDE